MQVDRFQASPVGSLVPISGEDPRRGEPWSHFAFVPHPLPDEPDLSLATHTLLSEADRAIGRLDANLLLLPSPELLVRPTLSKEAVSTSALEGTYATLQEVLEAEYEDETRSRAEVREVRNYIRAAIRGRSLITQKPVCLTLVAELQQMIVAGTRGDVYDAGQLRNRQVFIGDHGRPVTEARFVPCPPGEQLRDGMTAWEKWLNTADTVPLLVRVALAHYQFETLHPFSDGNGRVGRLVMTLQLIASGELRYPVLNMASWLEPRREQYINHLQRVSQTGDWDPWVAFFAEGLRDCAQATSLAVTELLAIKTEYTDALAAAGDRSLASRLAPDLIGLPILEVNELVERYATSYPTANNAVKKLVDMGILRQLDGRPYRRLFACDRVFQVMQRL